MHIELQIELRLAGWLAGWLAGGLAGWRAGWLAVHKVRKFGFDSFNSCARSLIVMNPTSDQNYPAALFLAVSAAH